MSSDISISFKNVSKIYSPYHGILKLKNFLSRVKNGQLGKKLIKENDFYALDHVSFDIHKGERVGIIGRNGAGKSTTLKLINRIAYPTQGDVFTKGHIGGLIELAAGFHPHLTGRDNVYINGAILGFTRKEIDGFMDSVISISELHDFIDVSIKKYSSGMKVRLGFAIMMATNPEIVLLDEVLAVGDQAFKKKSMEMMKQYMENKTLVFVSHSMSQISEVCTRVILIEHGRKIYDGSIDEGIKYYNELIEKKPVKPKEMNYVAKKLEKGFPEEPAVKITSIKIENSAGGGELLYRDSVFLKASYDVRKVFGNLNIIISVRRSVIGQFTDVIGQYILTVNEKDIQVGKNHNFEISFETENLLPGDYEVTVKPEFDKTPDKTAVVVLKKKVHIKSTEETRHKGLVNLGFKIYKMT